MASFVLEGLLDRVLAEGDTGNWFREHAQVVAIPFMDKDGVEKGDQGKNRRPRDHNRDYAGESIYPETAALRQYVENLSHPPCVALDLHCPYIRGERNELIYLVGSPNKAMWDNQQAFGASVQKANDSPLPYRPTDNLAHGTSWNTDANYKQGCNFAQWAETIPGMRMAASMEIPYANVGGAPVTPESARQFGGSIAEAIRSYLKDTCPVQAPLQP